MSKIPRQLSLVKLKPEFEADAKANGYPFADDMPLIFFGEIPNMPEHGVFAGHHSGRIYSGYHVWQFVELTDNEV